MAITSPRTQGDLRVGFAWQTAEGSAAASSAAVLAVCSRCQVDPGRQYIDPQGTFGSRFMKNTFTEVAKEPRASLTLFGSLEAMPTLIESCLMGQPTVSNSQLTEANDGGNAVGTWSFTGVRPGHNTEYTAAGACKLYVTVTDENPGAGQALVEVFKDAARSSLVASGSAADLATVTLAEQNNSGLTGSVVLGTVGATDSDIELTINTISYSFANQPARFFTLFKDTGTELEKLTDCVVESLSFSSADKEVLEVQVEVVAKAWAKEATALTGQPSHVTVYSHQDVTFRTAVNTAPVSESVSGISFGISHELFVPLASAALPTKIVLRHTSFDLQTTHVHSNEAQVVIDAAGSYQQLDATYTASARSLTVTWDKCQPNNPQIPEFSDREIGAVDVQWEVRENVAASPTSPFIITLQP